MNKLKKILSIFSLLFLLSACGQEHEPREVYSKFTSSLSQMTSVTDKSIDNHLTKRAIKIKNKGLSAFLKLPKDTRKPLEVMALGMLKNTKDWLNQKEAKLDITENTATLSTKVTANDTETTIVLVNFIKENGWKIDTISKTVKSKNSEMSEGLFR